MKLGALFDWMHFTNEFPGKDKRDMPILKKDYWKLLKSNCPTTPVMMDNPSDMYRRNPCI